MPSPFPPSSLETDSRRIGSGRRLRFWSHCENAEVSDKAGETELVTFHATMDLCLHVHTVMAQQSGIASHVSKHAILAKINVMAHLIHRLALQRLTRAAHVVILFGTPTTLYPRVPN